MAEFKQIVKAPLHEIDKTGNIRKIDNKSPMLAYPLGGNSIKLINADGIRQSFLINELVAEAFDTKKEPNSETIDNNSSSLEENITNVTIENHNEPITVYLVNNAKEVESVGELEEDENINEIHENHPLIIHVAKELPPIVHEKFERTKDVEKMPNSGKIISIKKIKTVKEKKVKKERKVSSDNPLIEKIMALDCYESIKMWKLHEIGISNADITILVNDPHDFVVVKTIAKFKNNETLRIRAEKVKV